MRQSIRLFCMWTLAVSLVGFSLLANAADPVPPPGNDITKIIAGRMPQAEDALESWQDTFVRKLANYDAYSKSISDAKFATDRATYCVGEDGQPSPKCDYAQPNSGDDMLASVFLDTRAYETEEKKEAAYRFITNITNPSPSGYPKDEDKLFNKKGGLSDEGINYFASIYRQIPSLTMVQNSLLAIYADRVRLDNFAQGLQVGEDGKASLLEMMYYEVERRYMNTGWYDQMNVAAPDVLLREIANMIAFQNYLELKRYEQMSRIEALLAIQGGTFGSLGAEFDDMLKEQKKEEEKQGGKKSSAEKQGQAEGAVKGAFGGGGG